MLDSSSTGDDNMRNASIAMALASSFENTASQLLANNGGSPSLSSSSSSSSSSPLSSSHDTALPTSIMVYQAGGILYENNNNNNDELRSTFEKIMSLLPATYLSKVLRKDIDTAFIQVAAQSQSGTAAVDEVGAAIRVLCGLFTSSSSFCKARFDVELCSTLVEVYDKYTGPKKEELSSSSSSSLSEDVLSILAEILTAWIMQSHDDGKEETNKEQEENNDVDGDNDRGLHSFMEVIKVLSADSSNCCLGDLLEWQQQRQNKATLLESMKLAFPETPEREYGFLMLESCPKSSERKNPSKSGAAAAAVSKHHNTSREQTNNKNKNTKNKSYYKPVTAAEAVQQRIKQVRDVIPSLGEGFIETALSCYNADVTRTITALLEAETNPSTLHPRLRAVDKQLPARRRRRENDESVYDGTPHDDEEARQLVKDQLKEMDKQQEREALILSSTSGRVMGEYDDDYDDQYDDGDGGDVGGADTGLYDVDFETIRERNRIVRETEKEDDFWESNRNTNRLAGKEGKKQPYSKDKDDDDADGAADGETSFRGPDKGKGGRPIGPDGKYLPTRKGPKKGKQQQQQQHSQQQQQQQQSQQQQQKKQGQQQQKKQGQQQQKNDGDPDAMSKIQKRRKNDNKAKIANHYRKERSQRKRGGAGM